MEEMHIVRWLKEKGNNNGERLQCTGGKEEELITRGELLEKIVPWEWRGHGDVFKKKTMGNKNISLLHHIEHHDNVFLGNKQCMTRI